MGRKRSKNVTKDKAVNLHNRDISAKEVFGNNTLCAQFLRDYIPIDAFKNVKAEDIEDVTNRFTNYFGLEFYADTVKSVSVKIGNNENGEKEEKMDIIIPLIDHKSSVDYNVSMQLLRYMTCVWANYEKRLKDKSGVFRNQGFKYPPIIPIVYYEGEEKWTASLEFKDRINMCEVFIDSIPNFRYYLVNANAYSKEELIGKNDEMSLIMLLSRVQTQEDIDILKDISQDKVDSIISNSSDDILDLLIKIIRTICTKMNVPEQQEEEYVGKVRKRQMGYLFENFKTIDIQAEERKAKEAAKKVEVAEKKVEIAEKKVEVAEKKVEVAEKKVEVAEKKVEVAEKKAEVAEKKAEEERKKAEEERKKAEEERKKAEEERKKAEEEKKRAEAAEKKVEEEKKKAEVSETKLQAMSEEMTTLREELERFKMFVGDKKS